MDCFNVDDSFVLPPESPGSQCHHSVPTEATEPSLPQDEEDNNAQDDTQDAPIALRRATRKRRIPARYGKGSDLLPSRQMAALRTYSQVVSPKPSPIPSPIQSPGTSRSASPIQIDPPSPSPTPEPTTFETTPNQFGLFRRFTRWPSVDPEADITIEDLIDAPTFIHTLDHTSGSRKPDDLFGPSMAPSNPFAPYLNATVYRLMNWYYQTGAKTLNDLNSLVHDVILAPDFDTNDLNDFSSNSEAKRLDDTTGCPTPDGWQESSVYIRLPQTRARYQSEDDAPEVEIPGVLHRNLLHCIVSAFQDPSFEAFHLKGFTQLWKPSSEEPAEEVYGEAYASAAFREMEVEVEAIKPPGEAVESVVVPIMAYSDSTHLATFGTASLWPIYFFIGLTSKYIRAKPASFSAHHLAYIPSVGFTIPIQTATQSFESFQTGSRIRTN